MSFDGVFTKAMTEEIASLLKGGRINKIHQPYKNELILLYSCRKKELQTSSLCTPKLCPSSNYGRKL